MHKNSYCIYTGVAMTDNRKDTLMKANPEVKAKIVNSKCGLIEITIPKPKSFFKKMQTFKMPSPIITHFFAQDNDAFKEMIGASFEYDRELMHEMHSDIKLI
jgi:CRISPR/Cas system endoribonuclease Cas6 (RAMP superfamily)